MRNAFELTFESYKMLTPTVRHLVFSKTDEQPLNFVPGQFITFHFDYQGIEYNRSYSISTIPGESSYIEIAVSPFPGGPGTEYLFSLETGERVKTTGPFGRLTLRDEPAPRRYILMATGTGVTPYRCMLPELLQRLEQSPTLEVLILHGVQKSQDLLYAEDFIAFSKKHPRLKFLAFYSREQIITPSDFEKSGHVQDYFSTLHPKANEDIFYLCGNPNMIDQSFNQLVELGFNTSNIRREKYISPKKLTT